MFLLPLLLSACAPSMETKAEHSSDLELISYSVPAGRADEVAATLSRVLSAGEAHDGRAMVGPNSTVVVVASATMQKGVKTLVESMGKTAAPAPRDIEIEYWLVVGRAGASSRAPGLTSIEPALAAIETATGPTAFQLVERLDLRSGLEEKGEASSRNTRVNQYAKLATDEKTILADLDIEGSGLVHTRVSLEPEQFLVLGQTDWEDKAVHADGNALSVDTAHETLYYIVRGPGRNTAPTQ